MTDATTWRGTSWQRVEEAAMHGALLDMRPDKSDWIRIWCIARYERGLPCTADAFEQARQEYRRQRAS